MDKKHHVPSFKGAVIGSNPINFFGQIGDISPHGPLAVGSVCTPQKNLMFVHNPGSVNGKTESGSDRAMQHYSSQSQDREKRKGEMGM